MQDVDGTTVAWTLHKPGLREETKTELFGLATMCYIRWNPTVVITISTVKQAGGSIVEKHEKLCLAY